MPPPLRTAALAAAALAIAAPAALGVSEPASEVAVKRGDRTVGALPTTAKPLFSRRELRELEERAKRLGRPIPDLRQWYRVPTTSPDEAEREAERIRRELGDHAHVLGPPAPPPVDEMCKIPPPGGWPEFEWEKPSPSLVAHQDYRAGLGFTQTPSVDGDGVEIATIEYSWSSNHEAIAHHDLDEPYFPFWWSHGDAVLSLLGGDDGEGSVKGLVPRADLHPRSPVEPTGFDLPATIVSTAADLDVGDVLLIEQQAWVPAYESQNILGPVEIDPAARAAIEAVVASGVTVVQPAGNNVGGGLNLVDLGLEGDSGAIIVAAGGAPQHDDQGHRAGFSNYGERIDFHAQGEALVAAGYGDLNPGMPTHRQYSACFGGTSGAAAIVAAAAAGVQGAAIESGRPPLTPDQLRQRLAVGAVPQQDPAADGLIGPQPWVPAAADFAAPAQPSLLAPGPIVEWSPSGVELRWTSDPGGGGSARLPDEVRVDGKVLGHVPAGHGRLQITPGPGHHTWSVRSADAAGNSTQSFGSFTVGSGAITEETSGGVATPPPPTVSGDPGDDGAPPKDPDLPAQPGKDRSATPKDGLTRRAATGVRSSWNRRRGRLALRFAGLAPRAVVRVSGKRVRVRRGKAVVRRARPGRLRVTVRARARGSVTYKPATFRVRVGKVRPAAKGVRTTWNPRRQRLTLHFHNLAPRAVVRVSGTRMRVRRGTVVVRNARPGSVSVTVRAQARGAVSYKPKTFRVQVGESPKTPNRRAGT